MWWELLFACANLDEPPADVRPDVLLVSLDTVRADVVGAYGASPSVTPNLDALAANGVRFREALTPTPLTLPAHTALLTGLYPDRTGVRDNLGDPLGAQVPTLAEQLKAHGWQTGAFVGSAVLDERFGLARGFDVYDDGDFDLTAPKVPGDPLPERAGTAVVQAFLAWNPSPSAPAFAWVHLYDAHQPWQRDYRGDVELADAALGAVRAGWNDRGRPLVVVVVADHGEGLGEHGESGHGTFLYRSTTRVPLVIAAPGANPLVISTPVSLVDVMPTILHLLGLPVVATDGQDLSPLWTGGVFTPTPVYSETFQPRWHHGFSELRAWEDGEGRYIAAPQPEWFAAADLAEVTNLVETDGARTQRFSAGLEAFLAQRPAVAAPVTSPTAGLEALGYLAPWGTARDGVDGATLPDPKTAPDLDDRFAALVVSARTQPPAAAVPEIQAFIDAYPGFGGARLLLSFAQERAGNRSAARLALDPLLEARPNDPALCARQASLWLADGDREGARKALLGVARPLPADVCAVAALAETPEVGAAFVAECLERAPADLQLTLVRGRLAWAQGDASAAADFDAVLEKRPLDVDANVLRAEIHETAGEWDLARTRLDAVSANPRFRGPAAILLAEAILHTDRDLDAAGRWLDLAEADGFAAEAARTRSAWWVYRGDAEAAVRAMLQK